MFCDPPKMVGGECFGDFGRFLGDFGGLGQVEKFGPGVFLFPPQSAFLGRFPKWRLFFFHAHKPYKLWYWENSTMPLQTPDSEYLKH